MSDETVREWLTAQLTPLLAANWIIVSSVAAPETLQRVTVYFTMTRIRKLPEAPRGHLTNDVTITILDPHKDLARAEDALDDDVLALVYALDALPGLTWMEASKVVQAETYLGWEITTNITSRKKATP